MLGFVYLMERRTCLQELVRKLGSGTCTDNLSESFFRRVTVCCSLGISPDGKSEYES